MLFTTVEFALFAFAVFLLYWALGKWLSVQNVSILIASYFFYAWWDWRFLSLLVISTLTDYLVGLGIGNTTSDTKRKWLLVISVFVNLGILITFKYYHFFMSNLILAFSSIGIQLDGLVVELILPLGISFYTLQTLSYTFDVYSGKLQPTRNVVAFAGYVSFFPQLVAGPIERATNLLPQFLAKRTFDSTEATKGLRQILWGFFKKVVIADNCAVYVDAFFAHPSDFGGSALMFGACLFAIQIYCDFSGYSDMAIGLARLFGFRLMRNFDTPFFALNIADFWRRWHISLTTWFRDYVYVPLGGSKGSTWQSVRNIMFIFLIVGLWHGANWTFVLMGFFNGVLVCALLLLKGKKSNVHVQTERNIWLDGVRMAGTFMLFSFTLIVFRSPSVAVAIEYYSGVLSPSLVSIPQFAHRSAALVVVGLITLMLAVEWLHKENRALVAQVSARNRTWLRWSFYSMLIFIIGMFLKTGHTPFIYFQF
jgi:D-alanyl-lipoteichoic acid acyltransferase DltB (MBOAT superfamily)